jgi:uncharacterized membrane protein YdjX (TVP38/TMEM64 family)
MMSLAWGSGVFDEVSNPESFAAAVRGLGAWGHLGFIVAYALLQPFGVPGTVFVVAAPLLWPWGIAFGLSMVGTMAASVIGFSFARFWGRDWIASRIPRRLKKYEEALAANAFETVFLLRLILWMPQLLHAFLGVSKVPFWTHFWASMLGYVPPILLVSYLGGELFGEDGKIRPGALGWMAALSVASVLLAVVLRRRTAARRRAQA